MGRHFKLIVLGAALALGCTNSVRDMDKPSINSYIQGKRATWERYGTNIIYKNFYEADFNDIPIQKMQLPSDLENYIRITLPRLENEGEFEEIVLSEAERLGYKKEQIADLGLKEVVLLSADIIAQRMHYYDVDDEPLFIAEHGRFLPVDRYFRLGVGDCDKYSGSFMWVFSIMKKYNNRLTNVYVTDSYLGGLMNNHLWNAILIPKENGLIVTHIDTARYDSPGELHCIFGVHVPESNNEFLARFYGAIWDFASSYDMYKRMLNENRDTRMKAGVLSNMAFAAACLRDKTRIEETREMHIQLGTEEKLDCILYYSYRTYEQVRDVKAAEETKELLFKKFPLSYWADIIRNQDQQKASNIGNK